MTQNFYIAKRHDHKKILYQHQPPPQSMIRSPGSVLFVLVVGYGIYAATAKGDGAPPAAEDGGDWGGEGGGDWAEG